MDKQAISKRLLKAEDAFARNISTWLETDEARPLSETPSDVTVNEAAHLWRVRREGSIKRGQVLEGADLFLIKLGELRPQKKLQQFVFKGLNRSGNLFFEKTTGQFVGAILTSRHPNT